MKLLRRLFLSWKASRLWISARDLVALKQYDAALEKLGKVTDLELSQLDTLQIRSDLLSGFIYFCKEEFKRCYATLESALERIERSDNLTQSDKIYLTYYALIYAAQSAEVLKLDDTPKFKLSYSDVDLDMVGSTWKESFPMRGHPDWQSS